MTNISFIPKGRVAVYVSEDDSVMRELVFKPDVMPESAVTLEGTRPDGGTFTANATKDGELLRVSVPGAMTSAAGVNRAQLVARDGEIRIGSQIIDLMVEPINRRIR